MFDSNFQIDSKRPIPIPVQKAERSHHWSIYVYWYYSMLFVFMIETGSLAVQNHKGCHKTKFIVTRNYLLFMALNWIEAVTLEILPIINLKCMWIWENYCSILVRQIAFKRGDAFGFRFWPWIHLLVQSVSLLTNFAFPRKSSAAKGLILMSNKKQQQKN